MVGCMLEMKEVPIGLLTITFLIIHAPGIFHWGDVIYNEGEAVKKDPNLWASKAPASGIYPESQSESQSTLEYDPFFMGFWNSWLNMLWIHRVILTLLSGFPKP